ncbi:enoyl-CoA hydratase/isomerase family protein [Nocardia sp. NPDC057440]|uniref:enoyl-CoA hydratase/isomerase family protein n=1 Tax=Nocardia sp. NPDC057440 TaxID=3346134 RepID=UPI0036725000
MGLIPGAGGTVRIPRRIGRWRTAWLALTGQRIDATTALEWGLVDEVGDGDWRVRIPLGQCDSPLRYLVMAWLISSSVSRRCSWCARRGMTWSTCGSVGTLGFGSFASSACSVSACVFVL